MRRPTSIALAVLLFGCAPTPVEVQAGFPSLETFLYSDSGRMLVYELEQGLEHGACPSLIEGATRNELGEPVLDSDWQPICAFRDGTVRFSAVPPGPHAYVMITRGEANAILLTGCTFAEAYEGAPPVEIQLFPTAGYASATEGRTLTCSSDIDKCQRGCR